MAAIEIHHPDGRTARVSERRFTNKLEGEGWERGPAPKADNSPAVDVDLVDPDVLRRRADVLEEVAGDSDKAYAAYETEIGLDTPDLELVAALEQIINPTESIPEEQR